eukprot:TRINITY_DN36074_c0_g1_i1.p1 TRINITY_DN36074_c0_g1~~TRINITY_DN36074_c0_g1_i1.p1  ORF type:complete len:596 (-),score=92.31 TRINITY_DN36074_c0_g1_i1:79-1866(-)
MLPSRHTESESLPRSTMRHLDGELSEHRLEKRSRNFAQEFNNDRQTWSSFRDSVYRILGSTTFEITIGAIIVYNIVVIIAEADAGARCRATGSDCSTRWLEVSNTVLLAVYTLESAGRLYVFRLHIRHRTWDLFDLVIVALTYVDLVITAALTDATLPGVQFLRLTRVAKIFRAVRLLRLFPELYQLFEGFLTAMSTMVWGFFMIFVFLMLIAVLTVEFMQPIGLEVFEEGSGCWVTYNSVWDTLILLFKTLMAGDSWGDCTVGIIKHSPICAPFFFFALILIQLGTTNLILAVVVQNAHDAHENNMHVKLRQISLEKMRAEKKLNEMCTELDFNDDGTINFEELMKFYDRSEELRRVFDTLDIREGELESLFNVMDKDGSGDLSYVEFVTCISRADSNDLRRQVMMLKLQLQDVYERVKGTIHETMMTMSQNIEGLMSEMLQSRPTRYPGSGSATMCSSSDCKSSKKTAISKSSETSSRSMNDDGEKQAQQDRDRLGEPLEDGKTWATAPLMRDRLVTTEHGAHLMRQLSSELRSVHELIETLLNSHDLIALSPSNRHELSSCLGNESDRSLLSPSPGRWEDGCVVSPSVYSRV